MAISIGSDGLYLQQMQSAANAKTAPQTAKSNKAVTIHRILCFLFIEKIPLSYF